MNRTYKAEKYSGKILQVDEPMEFSSSALEESGGKFFQTRIKIKYTNGMEGFEIVNFALSPAYIGRDVTVTNRSYQDGKVMKQEIESFDGLERLSIELLKE